MPEARLQALALSPQAYAALRSAQSVQVLVDRRPIDEIRIDLEPDQRHRMVEITGRRTVPQIFIGDTHVGGCDDLVALDQRGGLAPLLGLSA